VLIFLDRSFELLLKAILASKNRRLREASSKETFGFDKCIRVCLSDERVRCISSDEAITLQIINSLRDAAQHYILEISEAQLYLYAQAGVTLYKKLLEEEFGAKLTDFFPDRVLPVSSSPPVDLAGIIELEFEDIKRLVAPGHRRGFESAAKLRALSIVDSSLTGTKAQPNDDDLKKLVAEIRSGKKWYDIFPGVAALNLDTSGSGMTFCIRLTKKEGVPVRLVPEGTPGATIISVKRVNELDFYNLSLRALADNLSMSPPRALALIHFTKAKDVEDYFHVFKIGSQTHKRYSRLALDFLRGKSTELNMEVVWEACKPRGKAKATL
jgi:hypothetical protein